MKTVSSFIYNNIMGWKFEGPMPRIKKCVFAVVPHTHWMDFIVGLLIRELIGVPINFIGKKSLFEGPFGWFFKKDVNNSTARELFSGSPSLCSETARRKRVSSIKPDSGQDSMICSSSFTDS